MPGERFPRDESYRADEANRFETKLFTPRNINGEPNTHLFESIRAVESRLRNEPWFIGAAPFGSQLMGYATKDSDTDVAIFFDKSLTKGDQTFLGRAADLETELNGGVSKTPTNGIKLHAVDVSMGRISRFISSPDRISGFDLIIFCGPAIGPRVEAYRAMIGEEIKKLPDAPREVFLKKVGEYISRLDTVRRQEREARLMAGQTYPEQAYEKRSMMWRERALKLFNLSDHT